LPPDVPKERVATLRKAFAEALRDPELVAEAAKMKMDMTYRPPEDLERLIADLYQTPPALIATVKKLVPSLQ
jgi:tripartite-type tricarboxylate transporter receptor subunit TctC